MIKRKVCGGESQRGGMHAAIPGPEGGRNLLQLSPPKPGIGEEEREDGSQHLDA